MVGAHRLEAHRILGWAEIDAEILDIDAVSAKAREIAENLMRRELSPLDRAAFVAELYEVEKARAGWEEGRSAGQFKAAQRWAKDASAKIALASGLADQVAEKAGLSRRSVFNDLSLFKDIQPAVRQLLATHPVSENASQLRLLARSGEQARIAAMLVAGEAPDVARALDLIQPKDKPSGQDKAFTAFTGAWKRMGARERRRALQALEQLGLPKGVRITFDGGSDD